MKPHRDEELNDIDRKEGKQETEERLERIKSDYSLPQNKHLGPMIAFPAGPFKGRVYRRKPEGGLVRVVGMRAVKRNS